MVIQSKIGLFTRGNALDVIWGPTANLHQEGMSYMEV